MNASWSPRPLALVLAFLLWGMALATTLTIDSGDDPNARLEVRRVTLPNGTEVELLVLTGERIRVEVDDQVISGTRLEIDVEARVVRVIGLGSFSSGGDRVEGEDLELRFDEERLRALRAVVFTSAIDVTGEVAERLPGQLSFQHGLASPCSRCQQGVLDYAFRAARMVLYPGDRLVGFDVDILVRGVRILSLPVMVIPLADGDRQPGLVIRTGDARNPAEVRLRWPYVVGERGLGTFTIRYRADIDPSAEAGIVGILLGGRVLANYFGFQLDHRFYDDLGSGWLVLDYQPGLVALPAIGARPARPAATDATWTVRLGYAREAYGTSPGLRVSLDRNDAQQAGRWVYQGDVNGTFPGVFNGVGVRVSGSTRGFIDSDEDADPLALPAYASRNEPLRTLARVRIEPLEMALLRWDALRLAAASADLGFFQDLPDPANRRAAALGVSRDGRLELSHQLLLDGWSPWPGLRLNVDNRFTGRYYTTGERAVAWSTRIAVRQEFGRRFSVEGAYVRNVDEGETPFRFDASIAQARSELTFGVAARPLDGINLTVRGGYVLRELRRPEEVGWAPLISRVALFENWAGIDASLEHRWPIRDEDWGTLRGKLDLQGNSGPARLQVGFEHLQDLQIAAATPRISETFTRVSWRSAIDRVVALETAIVHRPEPAPLPDGRRQNFEPINLQLDAGSLKGGDTRPGVRLNTRWDLEAQEPLQFGIDLRGRVGPLEVSASERINLVRGVVEEARISAAWQGLGELSLNGLVWLPLALLPLDLPTAQPVPQAYALTVREDAAAGGRWQVGWSATHDPNLTEGSWRDSRLELRAALSEEQIGPLLFVVDGVAEWALADALQPETFLRRGSLNFGADVEERLGVQARFSYLASYDRGREELARSEWTIADLTAAGWVTDELLLGARVKDVWEFTGRDPSRSPWNLQPEFFFVWDRCCWALAGSWNSANGDVRLVLSGPGGSNGLEQIFETLWTLPRAPLRDPEGTP
jgi:hypothetical protein